MRSSIFRRILRLASQPTDAWTEIASEPGDPASLLLPLPALLVSLGPLFFVLSHSVVGGDGGALPLGRALGWSIVYYALVVLCLFGQSQVLVRAGAGLGARVSSEDALKLTVYASVPFLLAGVALVASGRSWESVVVVAAMIGMGYGAILLYQGLGILTRADARSRRLLAVVAAGSTMTIWVLGFFLLNKIIL